jgi:hypothetical protein
LNQPPKGQGERSAPAVDIRGFFAGLGIELPQSGGTNVSVRCFADREAHEHDDRSPSTSVNVETGAWMCHACGAAGGPYHAAQAVGLSVGETQSLLANHGLERRGGTEASSLATSEQELARYRETLLANEELLAELTQLRGWSRHAIDKLGLGLDGSRIVFPIRDANGVLVGGNPLHTRPGSRRCAEDARRPGLEAGALPGPGGGERGRRLPLPGRG